MRPLIPNFRATSFMKAFILNAIATSLISVFAVEMKHIFEEKGWLGKSESLKVFVVLLLTFAVAFLIYFGLFFLFGFGGGMIATPPKTKSAKPKIL